MDLETLRAYLLDKPGAAEEYPFGPDTLVLKVAGKIFALVAWQERPLAISLKCDPDFVPILRQQYPAVQPGYHLNKRHWNTVTLDGSIPEAEIHAMIDDSYDLVVDSLPKAKRQQLRGDRA
jgi:predicted DNA-binding protein (MmcQ/YjbR family)